LADNLAGQASIIDGDTLEVHGTRIRLWGIDAPESSQLCRGAFSSSFSDEFQTFQWSVILISTLGAVYIMVRGFDNMKRGWLGSGKL
jgi:hypothetical protein